MNKSDSISKIAVALVQAQSKMSNAIKDSKNPFFKSKYADLNAVREACLPALNESKISVLQLIVNKENKNYVETILLHESGEWISSETEIKNSKPNDPQAEGSGITYARRYGLQSIVCLGAEDDDGNLASNHKEQVKPETKPEYKKPIPETKQETKEQKPETKPEKKVINWITADGKKTVAEDKLQNMVATSFTNVLTQALQVDEKKAQLTELKDKYINGFQGLTLKTDWFNTMYQESLTEAHSF